MHFDASAVKPVLKEAELRILSSSTAFSTVLAGDFFLTAVSNNVVNFCWTTCMTEPISVLKTEISHFQGCSFKTGLAAIMLQH